MDIILYLKAIISRLLFMAHGIGAVYIYWEYKVKRGKNEDDKYDFFLLAPLFFIILETVFTLGYRKGVELKYFWPSGFFYITCLVPIIWLIEIDMFEQRAVWVNTPRMVQNPRTNSTTQEEENPSIPVDVLNAKIISNEGVKKISELGVVLGIIVGRWLIPRGTLTRDQLSALLLGYVSNSADILELLSTFEEPQLVDRKDVVISVMVVFTFSLYQFPLTTTATMETESSDVPKNKVRPATYGELLRMQQKPSSRLESRNGNYASRGTPLRNLSRNGNQRSISQPPLRKPARPSIKPTISEDVIQSPMHVRNKRQLKKQEPTPTIDEQSEQKKPKLFIRKLHGEAFQILVTLLMQDGPFLILRLYLMVKYEVDSELHVFFTCKNAIVSILLIYRLLVLSCEEDAEDDLSPQRIEAENKLRNIQVALQSEQLKDVKTTDMYVK